MWRPIWGALVLLTVSAGCCRARTSCECAVPVNGCNVTRAYIAQNEKNRLDSIQEDAETLENTMARLEEKPEDPLLKQEVVQDRQNLMTNCDGLLTKVSEWKGTCCVDLAKKAAEKCKGDEGSSCNAKALEKCKSNMKEMLKAHVTECNLDEW